MTSSSAPSPSSATPLGGSRWRSLTELTRTKTIATVGPACAGRARLAELMQHGVDIFRLNMAHRDRAAHQSVLDDVRAAQRETGWPVGVLIDLAGPKIRLGQLVKDPFECQPGSFLTFVRGETAGGPLELVCSYPRLVDELRVGDWVMLRDGLIRLHVAEKHADRVTCLVVDGGEIRSRQGVNLPGVELSVPALGPADLENARWAANQQVDFISLSFVRAAAELEQLRAVVRQQGSEALIVAKIEKREALERLESIVAASDAVMVARGDLGVEIDVEKTPMAQKRIIDATRAQGKPVIVATQMLESMHHSPQPTRAEVSDVANAILDGADACMLSGETAIGQFPTQAVRMMRKVMIETERILPERPPRELQATAPDPLDSVAAAVLYGAAKIASRVLARLVVVATSDGRSALLKSNQRDVVPTVAVTPDPAVFRRLCLYWGIVPFLAPECHSIEKLRQLVNEFAAQDASIRPNDKIVFIIDSEYDSAASDAVIVGSVH